MTPITTHLLGGEHVTIIRAPGEPRRGFCMIEGVDEHLAARITEVINRAYARGITDTRNEIKEALGIRERLDD